MRVQISKSEYEGQACHEFLATINRTIDRG